MVLLHVLKFSKPAYTKSFSTSALKLTIKNVTVVGGGTMGAGIAQV
jgi:hypothetical protein